MQNSMEREELVAYLLGRLAEPDRARLEERFFAETVLFDELTATEDELVDDYLAGRLGAADRRAFEEHYLASPERVGKVEAARQLRVWVARESSARAELPAVAAAVPQVSWWERIAEQFRMPAWALAAAAAALVVTAGGWWMLRQQQQQQRQQAPVVAQQQQPQTPQPVVQQPPTPPQQQPQAQKQVTPLFAFTLLPGTLRGAGDTDLQAVKLPQPLPAAARMQLRLETPPDQASYRVAIETADGRTVWAGTAQPIRAESSIRATVPLAGLTPGDYLVRVTAANGESIADYSMRVQR